MADVAPTISYVGDRDVVTWTTLVSANANGSPYQPERLRAVRATVQAIGTWDTATLVLQGSNDGTNWYTLNDAQGTAISFTADGYAELNTASLYIRPSTSSHGAGTDLDVILVARGNTI